MTDLDNAVAEAVHLLSRRVGLRVERGLTVRLRRAIAAGAAATGATPGEWVASATSDERTLDAVIDAVTVDESSWFRDPAQFEVLRTSVLPPLAQPLVWSIGTAAGQEPYSLAMTLVEAGRPDGRVLATDVSARAVAACRAARFTRGQMRGLDGARRDRFMLPDGDGWVVRDEIRAMVSSKRHNVVRDALPTALGSSQVVFCRNVLIYCTEDGVAGLFSHLSKAMAPDAFLFLGTGEALWRALDLFEPSDLGGCVAYRPRLATEKTSPGGTRSHGALRRPPPPATGRTHAPAAQPLPDPAELAATGTAALDRGEVDAAIRLLRQAVYLDPADPAGHFALGLALEARGDHAAARRAWRLARSALEGADAESLESRLGGHTAIALAVAIAARLDATAQP